jgi:hypothetical protein
MFPEQGILTAPILNCVYKALKNQISWNFIASSQVRDIKFPLFLKKALDSIL